ncbi:MAG: hypothetical protein GEV10_18720 [Streptosporangiales bacterium]|nr:hypothetical protein [Streptosporangiales bacterium]
MNPRLAAIADAQHGPFTRAQALACGLSDDELRHLVRVRELRRLRRGAYVQQQRYDRLDAVGRHVLRAHAVGLSLEDRTAFSHVTAAALHGLVLWDVDLSLVHVTRLDTGAARRCAGVDHHAGMIDAAEVVRVCGLPAVHPARAVVEVALTSGLEASVVAADSALRRRLATKPELDRLFGEMRLWPCSGSAGRVISFADGLSESVGESRARVLFARQGLPVPVLQREIVDEAGRFVARVDFLFEDERVVVEFDGDVKYRGTGVDPSDVVIAEKRREDRLRELGYEVVRVTWSDLAQPERTARRILAAFARNRTRSRHPRTA